jgi:hypothetical protein
MTTLWLALGVLLSSASIGWIVDRVSGAPLKDRSPLAWLTFSVHGLAALTATAIHPLLGVLALVGLAVWSRRLGTGSPTGSTPSSGPALAVIVVLALVITLQPPVPMAWDELVWLARARIGAEGPFALTSRALDPSGGLTPAGYPIGAGVLQAAFAGFDGELTALTSGTSALVLFAASAFVLVLRRTSTIAWGPVALVVMGAPLMWVHLRTGMLDLPLGLFAATFAMALLGARSGDATLMRLAPALAVVMSGLKDEGAMYVAVIALACLGQAALRRTLRTHAGLAVLIAVAVVGTWRARLMLAGVSAEHHAAAGFALGALPDVLRELLRAACDVRSFGASLALVVAAIGMSLVTRGGDDALASERALSIAWLACVGCTLLALLLGPDAVRSFATSGTLWPRFLIQLVPLGACIVGARLQREAAGVPVAAPA